jgi:hypothetical protein
MTQAENWKRCQLIAAAIPPEKVIAGLVALLRKRCRRYHRATAASILAEVVPNGGGVRAALAERFGLGEDQQHGD